MRGAVILAAVLTGPIVLAQAALAQDAQPTDQTQQPPQAQQAQQTPPAPQTQAAQQSQQPAQPPKAPQAEATSQPEAPAAQPAEQAQQPAQIQVAPQAQQAPRIQQVTPAGPARQIPEAASGEQPRQALQQNRTAGPGAVVYECQKLPTPVEVRFLGGNVPSISVAWENHAVRLPRALSASGARYAAGWIGGSRAQFWIKGNEARFTLPSGATVPCIVAAQ